MTIISPTIGRKVWFWPNGSHIGVPAAAQPQSQDPTQAMDATIVLVHGDRMVNLLVLDHHGVTWPVRSVTLLQEGDLMGQQGMYAQWMPYQVKQAAKEDAAAAEPVNEELFSVGDVVQLKSGGPAMTIESHKVRDDATGEGTADCIWQAPPSGDTLRATFNTEMLDNLTAANELFGPGGGLEDFGEEEPAEESPTLTGLTFGQAIEALKAGQRLTRSGWNGVGLWLEYRPGNGVDLPFIRMSYPVHSKAYPLGARVPWLASQSDTLAEDWALVE